jgi:6-pyruvoyltetrahydropterin/6-carboxytetrahydropterin synthase
MFEVKVQGRFSAAHNLVDYQGDCEKLHGHNWLVELAVAGRPDKSGMVVDFRVLKKVLDGALEELDHKYLNELEYFKDRSTTTENIAEYIFCEVAAALPGGVSVKYVSTWESPGCGVTYRPGGDLNENGG